MDKEKRDSENIRVFVRIRPFLKKEQESDLKPIVVYDPAENVVALRKNNVQTKPFKFDHVFGPNIQQFEVYRIIAAPIVEQALQGYNGTIFAYGQSGTGKTYTMSEPSESLENKGIIPNTFSHIFTQIALASNEKSFVVTVTYLQIYNDEIRDLLSTDTNKKLQIKEREDIGIYVTDLSGFTVDSVESITKLLERGNRNRITKSTLMNSVSSRSHAIFTITIESKNSADNTTTVGKLNLVDLAGSERASRTMATGERLKEGTCINLSLTALGKVISALVDKLPHVPYRDSKLTRLLQDSLGGNSKTAMIAMLSPSEIDYEENLSTLRYAAKVKQVKNCAKINLENKGLIESFEHEIAELRQKLSQISLHEEQQEQGKRKQKKKEKPSEADLEKSKETDEALSKIEREKKDLTDKMERIKKKIICGGDHNLLEKVKEQQFLLETTGQEIINLDRSHQELEEQLSKKAEEKTDIQGKFSSLQEEDVFLTRKIKMAQVELKEAKEDNADKEHEYQREMEGLIDNNRLLVRENQLANLMVDTCIPNQYKEKIKSCIVWSSETQEFQMKGVAYSGNNMRKRQQSASDTLISIRFDMKQVFHKYPEKRREKPKEKRSLLKCYSAVPKSR